MPLILLILLIAIAVGDWALYAYVVLKHGPQYNWWPLSGYFVWWKHRKERW